MRLPRPHVPIAVKIAVAKRQLAARGTVALFAAPGPLQDAKPLSGKRQLVSMLWTLLGDPPWHLDHDPPLMQRVRTKDGGYRPGANNEDYLVWRTAEDHRLKTYIRGDGAQLSDAGKRRKEIRRKRKATRPKWKWPARKLQSRPMRRSPP